MSVKINGDMGNSAYGVPTLPRDPSRIVPILNELENIWINNPQLRLGQIISNACAQNGIDIFYVEDDVMLEGLKALQQKEMISKCSTCSCAKTCPAASI